MADWRAKGKAKADSIIDLIPREWRLESIPTVEEQRDVTGAYIQKFLTKEEVAITETDAVGIVCNTTGGIWSAVEVAKAFCHRAALAHQLVNCLHEIFFDAAIADAERADRYLKENGKPIGPLHGLPISLKDQFHVKGVETHMGYIGWIGTFQGKKGSGKEKVYESEMVRELRSLGATLYVKTSVPHTLMCGETINNIIGYTQNPTNRNVSADISVVASGCEAVYSPLEFWDGDADGKIACDWWKLWRGRCADCPARQSCRVWYRHWRLDSHPSGIQW